MNLPLRLLLGSISIAAAAGCGVQGDTINEVRAALELPLGGYEDEEVMPSFGIMELDRVPVDPRITTPQRPDGIRSSLPASREGVIVARWSDLVRAHGLFWGKWADASGNVVGHFKGLYGRSRKHKGWVMFGKMVDPLGYPKGLLKGSFHSGLFQASWVDEAGKTLGMVEGVSRRDSLQTGLMLGHWDRYPDDHERQALASAVNPL